MHWRRTATGACVARGTTCLPSKDLARSKLRRAILLPVCRELDPVPQLGLNPVPQAKPPSLLRRAHVHTELRRPAAPPSQQCMLVHGISHGPRWAPQAEPEVTP